ncbi:FtsW/RodA/SpoVE family cell cycle protein [Lentilactobacillus sp. SPB1-3]|uniref:FtsW/RodA/SpoVE family cell cycle protein n=1 Tax=Lentilactobacillus terminaliae TaxID=3003483 RepID=A0ACD5DDU5_9LACO|nr:FtsW/RodA/SpoVE family cell cycle protein [Lentilactobacillus sp. SPB1-3]MCZ0977865.1 FtsW/RodA/SpoVE family cell cycle protein [Lentilactobacillus sp. SPB1-3]
MKRLRNLDYYIFLPYIIMCTIGVIMVYSASANIGSQNGGSPMSYLIKQSLFVVISLVLVAVVTAMNLNKFKNKRALSIIEIGFWVVFVCLLFFGSKVNGAAGWINLGFINIQPAEFFKFFLIIRVANSVDTLEDQIILSASDWWVAMRGTIIRVMLSILLILAQPDSGGAAINFMIFFVLMLTSGISFKRATEVLGGFIALVFVGVNFVLIPLSHTSFATHSYQIQRIVAFTDPFGHAQGTGQQLVNSYYAISNGGLFGVGLGNSIQKTGYLPEPNTDFIMSVLTEELGVSTALIIMGLLTLIVARTVLIGIRSTNTFNSLICYGVATYLTIQTLFNIGGVIGLLPITGVTFPFISYGGSSILTLSLCIGLILNISGRQKEERLQAGRE